MLNWASKIMKTWQLTVPDPMAFLSISCCIPSVVLTRRVALPCISLTGHRAQIDQKPELIFGVELLQSHMLGFVFFFHKEAG